MALSKKFSELPSASSLTNNDLFAIAHEDSGAETGYESQKATATQIAKKILNGIEFPTDLPDFPANEQNPIDALEYLNEKINDLYPVVDVSGSIANFNTPLSLPLVNLKANITVQQAGTGTPSPSNPRAISGWSSIDIIHAKSNLFDSTNEVADTFIKSDGYRRTDSGANGWTSSDYILIKANTTYHFNPNTTSGNLAKACFYSDKDPATVISYIDSGEQTFTTPTGARYARFSYRSTSTNITLNVGSTALPYEAFDSDKITVNLGDTYYGGKVNVKEGAATITQKYFTYTEVLYYGTYGPDDAPLYYMEIPDYDIQPIKNVQAVSSVGNLLSNMLTKTSASSVSNMRNNEIRTQGTTTPRYFYFRADDFADLTALNAFLANNPMQVVAELQTPIEITGLTADNFTTLVGTNNIFADSGDIEVSFKQGIQEYIDAEIAKVQALALNS